MRIFDIFGGQKSEFKSFIEIHNIEDWFFNLSESEQEVLKGVVGPDLTEKNSIEIKPAEGGRTTQQTLGMIAKMVWGAGHRELAEKLYKKALNAEDDNPTDRHFIYLNWEKLLYKERNEDPEAIEKCIALCKQDISQVDEVLPELEKTPDGRKINIDYYSFKRLAIIYEKSGEYEKAVEVCDKALNHNVSSNTKMGWEGRKKKLKAKLRSED